MGGSVEKPGIGNAWPVGVGFRPREDELINDYLTKKVRGLEEDSQVIPELNIYQLEPQTLFEKFNAMSYYPSDGGECFFYCPKDGKNRKTKTGFWKETRKKRTFRNSEGEIGSKRIFVYRKGRQPYGRKSSFSMHEYHLNRSTYSMIAADQGPAMEFVLCHIINRKVKKIKPDSSSEYIEPDRLTPGDSAVNQVDKDNEPSPQVCDPKTNLTDAEAGGHDGRELLQYEESIFDEHRQFTHNVLFDGPVDYRDHCPDDVVFISELWD